SVVPSSKRDRDSRNGSLGNALWHCCERPGRLRSACRTVSGPRPCEFGSTERCPPPHRTEVESSPANKTVPWPPGSANPCALDREIETRKVAEKAAGKLSGDE